jgi:hypothetical protein
LTYIKVAACANAQPAARWLGRIVRSGRNIGGFEMRKSLTALVSAAALLSGATAFAETPPTPGRAPGGSSGVNVGTLSCNVAGGIGFVFGSSKALSCIFTRTDGVAERYAGEIKRFGIDIGFTKEAQIIWMVFAPGAIAAGSLAGDYGGATVQGTVGIGAAVNVLVGGSSKQITLQPVSIEGSLGLNVAGGLAEISLKPVK